jgi:DNA-binding transcriptional ArsR family regulator
MNQQVATSRNILACLGDSSRFRLVLSLLERERCVTELAAAVGLSQSCTTRHLQYLEREGLVRGVRQGKRVMFRLRSDRARVRELMAWVTAASPEQGPARVSGADLHADGAEPAGGAPTRADRPQARRSPATRPRASKPRETGPAAPGPNTPDSPPATGVYPSHPAPQVDGAVVTNAFNGNDMEDWLL